MSNIKINEYEIPVKAYKDGSVDVKIPQSVLTLVNSLKNQTITTAGNIILKAHLKTPTDLLALLYLLDYFEEHHGASAKIILALPFIPNGRQDRLNSGKDGETGVVLTNLFTLKSVAKLVNVYSCVSKVLVTDAHSLVSTSLLHKVSETSQRDVMVRIKDRFDFETDVIVSPDLGAYKKALEVASAFKLPLTVALKNRDPLSNEITETSLLQAEVKGKRVLIVDDILDGGRTFIPLAKLLKEAGASHVALAVTHGLFSYGYEALKQDGYIDVIFSYYCWMPQGSYDPNFIKVVENF